MKPVLVRALAVLLLGLALHAPRLSRPELENEEGRRALPAREMLETGDFVLPTLFGEPYLSKPPGIFYAIAASARLLEQLPSSPAAPDESGWFPAEHGPVSPLAVRLPSLLATLVCALALLLVAPHFEASLGGCRLPARGVPSEAGSFAAVLFLLAPSVARKARLGEIELALTVASFLAGLALWFAVHGPRLRLLFAALGGLCLWAALLLKGPVALLFTLPVGLVAAGRRRPLRGWLAVAMATGIAGALMGLWLIPLAQRFPDPSEFLAVWAGEIARNPESGLEVFLRDRRRLVFGSLLGWLPASGVVIAGLIAGFRGRAVAGLSSTLLCIGLPALVLLAWPEVRARYAMPLLPWVALAAGLASNRWLQGRRASGRPGFPKWVFFLFGLLCTARWVQLLVVDPARDGRARHIESARVLDGLVASASVQGVLWVEATQGFKTLYYMRQDVRWVERADLVPAGGLLLRGPAAQGAPPGAEWEPLEVQVPTPKLADSELWRRR